MSRMEYTVVTSCNKRYAYGALTALASVAVGVESNVALHFHIFTEGFDDMTIEMMRSRLCRIHENTTLINHPCDESMLEGLPLWGGTRMSAVRCLFPRELKDVDVCLYIDCDILFLPRISEFFQYYSEDVCLVSAKDEGSQTVETDCRWIRENLKVDIDSDHYFGASCMIMNLSRMRREGVTEKLLDFFAKYDNAPFVDQTAFNAVLFRKVIIAPSRFNRLQLCLDDEKMRELPVIHYAGGNPWVHKLASTATHRFRLWHKYSDMFVWGKSGESFRRTLPRKVLFAKYLAYWALHVYGLRTLVCFLLSKKWGREDVLRWEMLQLNGDCSSGAVRKILRQLQKCIPV